MPQPYRWFWRAVCTARPLSFCTWLLLAGLLALTGRATAQAPPAWQSAMVAPNSTTVTGSNAFTTASVADAAGNLFMTGIYQGQVSFGGTVLNAGSQGNYAGFVAKWSASTRSYVWAYSLDNRVHTTANQLALSNGNVYVVGEYEVGTLTLGSTALSGSADGTAYVAKLTDAGSSATWTWAQRIYGTTANGGSFTANGVAALNGLVYVAGSFATRTCTVGSITLTNTSTSTSDSDMYLGKLTDNGSSSTWSWATAIQGTGGELAGDVHVSGSSIYVAGAYYGGSAVLPGGTTLPNAGSLDVLVAKLSDAGSTASLSWATRIYGPTAQGFSHMALQDNHLYLTGKGGGTTSFGSGALTRTAAGPADAYVTRLTDAGSSVSFDWATGGGGSGEDSGTGVAVSGSSVYLTSYVATLPGTFGTTTTGTGNAVTLSKLQDNGTAAVFQWTQNGGTRGTDGSDGVRMRPVVVGGRVAVVATTTVPTTFGSLPVSGTSTKPAVVVATLTDTAPLLTAASPGSGAVGSTISLTGTNLTGTTTVTFAGSSGSSVTTGFSVNAAGTSITGIVVPSGASSGAVTVTTPAGTSNGVQFTVTPPALTTTSFSPTSGPAGTRVTITGTGLEAVTGVRFGTGALTTNVVSQSATSLTVLVPVVAATGPLTLTTDAGASVRTTSFTYTPRTDLVASLSPTGPLDACQPRTLTATATSGAFGTGTGFDNYVQTVVTLADGKVLAGGQFTTYNGTTSNRLVRLNADGSRDASFAIGSGFNGNVQSLAVQADGKVLVGGNFTQYNGTAAPYLVRLNADGSRDASFAIGSGFSNFVYAVAVQTDGKVLVGGLYSTYNGTTSNRLVRLNADGSRDASFAIGSGFNGSVAAITVQADGKVLVGGQFTIYDNTTQNRLMRLNADGSRDASFVLAGTGFGNTVLALALQPDGKVLVGGNFAGYRGNAAGRVARLQADGSFDAGFGTGGSGFNNIVYAVALQADGKALAGGTFTTCNGSVAPRLLRLTAAGSRNDAPSAVSGATFTFSPGNTTTNPLVTSTAGSYTVTASLDGGTSAPSNTVVLTACAVPTLTALTPASGPVGTSVTITGTTLAAATSVSFNGTVQTVITANTDSSLTVTVPAGTTTGLVTVTTPGGTSNGLPFTVTYPDLVITTGTSAAPVAVAAGTYNSITVTGTGYASLSGAVVVNSAVSVSGGLATSCQPLTGAGSFTLAAGATLHICDVAGISTTGSSGAVQVTGTRSFSPDASYVYDSPNDQLTGPGLPATVRNLTSTNPTTLTLSQAVAIREVLTLNAGDLNTFGQSLTLLSDATGTALVANLGAGVLQGNVTVQRYLDGSLNPGLGYRHLTPPALGQTVAAFASGGTAQVANDDYNTSATPTAVTPFPTVFSYDQARLASSPATTLSPFDKGWRAAATLSEGANVGTGYTVQLPGASTLSFTGVLHQTSARFNLVRASGPTAADAGWNFIGNSFPSPVDLSTIAASQRVNVDAAVYVYESTGRYAGQYRSYVGNVGNPIIGTAQAFFVRVSSGRTTGSFDLLNRNRVTSYDPDAPVRRRTETRPLVQLTLDGAGVADELTVYAEAGATNAADTEFDALKLTNPHGLDIASVTPTGELLAIDGRPAFATGQVVPLVVRVPQAGRYTFAAPTVVNLPAGLSATLLDLATGTRTTLTNGATYTAQLPAGSATSRFLLELGSRVTATTSAQLAQQVSLFPNPTTGHLTLLRPATWGATTVQVLSSVGQVVLHQHLTTTDVQLDVRALPAGVYQLRLLTPAGVATKRLVRQ